VPGPGRWMKRVRGYKSCQHVHKIYGSRECPVLYGFSFDAKLVGSVSATLSSWKAGVVAVATSA
jgi:hypothetical protein